MNYHKLTRVFSLLMNSNPKLNIIERMEIISSVNEYLMVNENKIIEMQKQINKLNDEVNNLKTNDSFIKNK